MDALTAVEVAGGVIGDAQVFVWGRFVADGTEVFGQAHDLRGDGAGFLCHLRVIGEKLAVLFEHGAAAAAVGDDQVIVCEDVNVVSGHLFGERDHAVGLLGQAAAINGGHFDAASGLFDEGDGGIGSVLEEEFHGAAFEIGDAPDLGKVNTALFRRFGKDRGSGVAHGFGRGVVGGQETAGETRELQALGEPDEGAAHALERVAGHETADEAVFWREAVVFAQPLADLDHGFIGHDFAGADFGAGFAEQAIVEGVAQFFGAAVELAFEKGAHDGDLAAGSGAVLVVDLIEGADGGAGAAAVALVDDGAEFLIMRIVFVDGHCHHRPKILPGLRMLFGSRARLIRREASISSFSSARPM